MSLSLTGAMLIATFVNLIINLLVLPKATRRGISVLTGTLLAVFLV